jgi:hypothetical protein
VIYVDSSVVLAQLLAEDRTPPDSMWRESLVSSRLMEYEVWNRLNSPGVRRFDGDHARSVIGRIALLELAPPVLARALEPFRHPVRTLDALHLASIEFLRARSQSVELASYDRRMLAAAAAMDVPVYPL